LRNRPEIGLIYMHTTDYPMHMWPPEAPESQEHLSRLDSLLAELAAAAPEAAILLTAAGERFSRLPGVGSSTPRTCTG